MAVYASSLASVRTGLAHLAPFAPPEGRPLLTSFVAQLGPTVAAFRAGHAAALAHHYSRALTDVQRGFTLFARASAKPRRTASPQASARRARARHDRPRASSGTGILPGFRLSAARVAGGGAKLRMEP
jgi:hypothetical protein